MYDAFLVLTYIGFETVLKTVFQYPIKSALIIDLTTIGYLLGMWLWESDWV